MATTLAEELGLSQEKKRLGNNKFGELKWNTKVMLDDSLSDLKSLTKDRTLKHHVMEKVIKIQTRLEVYKQYFDTIFRI